MKITQLYAYICAYCFYNYSFNCCNFRWAVFHWIQMQTIWKGQHRKAHVQCNMYISYNTTNLWRLVLLVYTQTTTDSETVPANAQQTQIKVSVQCTCFWFPLYCRWPRVRWLKGKKNHPTIAEKKLCTFLK